MSRDTEPKFKCDRCGLCCRKLKGSPLAMLDRGDGVCRYLNDDNLCTIYENRPLICNVDKLYDNKYSGRITREAYHLLQEQACKKLKEEANQLLGDMNAFTL